MYQRAARSAICNILTVRVTQYKLKKTPINGPRQNIGTEIEQQTSEKLRSEQAAQPLLLTSILLV